MNQQPATTSELTFGNYFIVGMSGKKLRTHSPYFGVPQDIMIAHINDYGRFDEDVDMFWTKVPAFIPGGPDRRWQPIGGEKLSMYATVLIHCCGGKVIEFRKGDVKFAVRFPEEMHLKTVPMMLPSMHASFSHDELDEAA